MHSQFSQHIVQGLLYLVKLEAGQVSLDDKLKIPIIDHFHHTLDCQVCNWECFAL